MRHLQSYQLFESTIFNQKHIQKIADKASDEMDIWFKGQEDAFSEDDADRYSMVDEYVDAFLQKSFPHDTDFIATHREDIIMAIIGELEDDLQLEPAGLEMDEE